MQAPTKLRVESLARECAELSPELRYARLDAECNSDEEFRKEVEAAIRKLLESQKTDILTNDYEKAIPAHYRLIELLGRGGMAEVFRAEDTRLNRSVAIKFLNSEFRKDPERMRRFNQEARAVSALNHPNILVIHDVGENEGIQYIVTEFVDGETLSRRISRGTIPLHEAVEIAVQIASALAASHNAGIVHRDVKPDNVMIRRDGVVKVLDFGLAKETIDPALNAIDANAATLDKALTSPGLILGTPQYMSPEQARGRQLDARTDIFSLGIIIFEMASGRPPFQGGSMVDVIASIIGKDTPRLEDHMADPPESLRRIVDKSLRKNVEERYGTMDSLMSDLKEAQRELAGRVFDASVTAGQEVRTTVQNTAETEPFKFRHWNAVFAALALVAAGLALWWYFGWPGSPTTPGAMRTVAITSWSSESGELSSSASFSPDGRMIAYGATHDGSTEIWLKPTAGGDAIQITKNGFFNQYPVWSPNGQEIAFFSSRGTNRSIWRTSFTGGEQIEVVGGLSDAARPTLWSKSGKIYFQDANELFVVDDRSGQKSKLTDFAGKGVKPRAIEPSPDETTIAYAVEENDLWKIRSMPIGSEGAAGSEIATSKDQIDFISWRPDGKSIIFSMPVEGASQLFETGPGIETPRQISNGANDFFVQDIASDESKILFASVTETSDLWSVSTEDSNERLIASEVAAEYWPDVSPDGKGVAFQSVKQIERVKSGSINIAGAGVSRVISQSGYSPVWSNDGRWIAFFRRTDGQTGLWRVRPGGDEASKISETSVKDVNYETTPYLKFGTSHLSWSPDSSLLAYAASPDDASNIWIANINTNSSVKATRNENRFAALSNPVWTPDGNKLIFFSSAPLPDSETKRVYRLTIQDREGSSERTLLESNDLFRFLGLTNGGKRAVFSQRSDPASLTLVADTIDVFAVSLETGEKTPVNKLRDAYFNNIHLSRDGSTLAFVSRRDNTTALWTVPVDGGTPKRLLAENDPKILFSSLAWSPDGKSIVFGKQTRTNLISMLAK